MSDALTRLSDALADRYRLERELGQGGMATVYLAQDIKHRRKVALKVLKPELGAVLGVERFLAEIQVTANLQHPNLLPLFDSGEADGLLFYVMPFVEGETLRARLDREKQLPVDEAVRLAVAIAGALDYAHKNGVIHRDLKPENILLQAAQPVIADFGIALAVSNAGGARVTQTGLSLGTPQYMSPEQATGDRVIDARTDVYSLGAMTYEMLAGEPPHLGSTAQALIAKLMTEEVRPITVLRKSVPPHVDAAVRRALEKLAADRFSTAGEFAQALTGARPFIWPTGTMPAGMASTGVGAAATLGMSGRTRALVGALALLAVAGVSAAAWLASRPVPEPVAARFALALPDSVHVGMAVGTKVAISRDGSRIAILGLEKRGGSLALYLRRADDPVARLVRGSEQLGFGYTPRFSPDGEWLIIATAAGVRKVPAAGGTAQTISQSGSAPSWGDGGTVVFVRAGQLWIGDAEGRDARLLAAPDSAAGVYRLKWPHILPGAEYALVVLDRAIGGNLVDSLRLGVVSLRDGSVSDLGVAGTDAQYSATGHIVYGRAGGLVFAAPFSLAKRALTGPATLVLEDVWQGTEGATSFAVSDNGTLVYQRSSASGGDHMLLRVDAEGRTRQIPAPLDTYWSPQLSPNGQRLAVGTASSQGGTVWLVDMATGAREQLGPEAEMAMRPEWTRDGTRVLLIRESRWREVVARSWNRSSPDQVLLRDTTNSLWEIAVGPGGSPAVLRMRREGLSDDLFVAPVDSLGALRSFLATAASERSAAISSDGQRLAYASNESGILEVYVQPFPGPGGRVQVSVGGGSEPIWSNAGSTLFYRGPSSVMRAELAGIPLQVQRRDTLFRDTFLRDEYGRSAHRNWDVFPGDREFLMIVAGGATGSELFAVVNWPQLRTIRSGER